MLFSFDLLFFSVKSASRDDYSVRRRGPSNEQPLREMPPVSQAEGR